MKRNISTRTKEKSSNETQKRKKHKNKKNISECNEIQKMMEDEMYSDETTIPRNIPHTCYLCDITFATKACLIEHVRDHVPMVNNSPRNECEDGPYICSMCEKTFTSKYYIKNHMYVHTINKPFKCKLCTESFIQEYFLKHHVKTKHKDYETCNDLETNELSEVFICDFFECKSCTEKFNQKWKLNRHIMKAHTPKPEKLDEHSSESSIEDPNRFFSFLDQTNSSKIVQPQDKSYNCHVCNKKFWHYSNLELHINFMHNINELSPSRTPKEALSALSRKDENPILSSIISEMELTNNNEYTKLRTYENFSSQNKNEVSVKFNLKEDHDEFESLDIKDDFLNYLISDFKEEHCWDFKNLKPEVE